MIKFLLIIFVIVVIFSWALYIGIFEMLWNYILVINSDFLPYIPLELRLWFFMIILGLIIAMARSFIN